MKKTITTTEEVIKEPDLAASWAVILEHIKYIISELGWTKVKHSMDSSLSYAGEAEIKESIIVKKVKSTKYSYVSSGNGNFVCIKIIFLNDKGMIESENSYISLKTSNNTWEHTVSCVSYEY